ncbi:uncharacterized protein METZ01_LOCUS458538 [marine metagenome]|uniref:Uncharacterized protein n=1 Tax=marine metagenome TaxID=408172 RepID=A0A383ADC2_9ZZZZ|tara:strand:- start:85 stop:309 length:225 start_codon:yes stop_codon:yes gene_type:complete
MSEDKNKKREEAVDAIKGAYAFEEGVINEVTTILASGKAALKKCTSVGEMRRLNKQVNEAIRMVTKWERREDWG